MEKIPVRLRQATEADAPFIFNAWLKSFRNSPLARTLNNTTYFSEHHKVIEKILKNSDTIIACNNNDPNQIFGFISASKVEGIFCLHYIYVKHTFRKLGIGSQLLNVFEHDPTTASIYTHHTKTAEKLAPKFSMMHHPYVLFNNYKLEKISEEK